MRNKYIFVTTDSNRIEQICLLYSMRIKPLAGELIPTKEFTKYINPNYLDKLEVIANSLGKAETISSKNIIEKESGRLFPQM